MSHKSEKSDEDWDEEVCINEDEMSDKNDIETGGNTKIKELEILYNAALILRQKVQEIPKLYLPWPPLAPDLTMDNVKKMVPHELFNVLAWICGFSSEPTLSEYVPIDSKESSKLCQSHKTWFKIYHLGEEIPLPSASHLPWHSDK